MWKQEDIDNVSPSDSDPIYTISSAQVESPPYTAIRLRWPTKLAFGVGHMFNDLCACMWFTYVLVYFVYVLEFPRDLAGLILLVGQIVDGLSTVFAGTVVNIIVIPFIEVRYGKRKTWHLIGSALTFLSFPFIFMPWPWSTETSKNNQLFYYLFLVAIFQFGWACVQVSHLALTPVMSDDIHVRSELNTLRNCFQVLANITVYTITGVAIGLRDKDSNINNSDYVITFRNIVLTIVAIGFVTCVIFHGVVSEKARSIVTEVETSTEVKHTNWLKKMSFYKVTLVFTSSRLFLNLTQVYVPFYLKDTLQLADVTLAIVPLIMYLSGFFISFPVNYCNKFLGRQATYVIGCLVGIAGCAWSYFGVSDMFKEYLVYVFAGLIGIASSTIQIASLTMTSDMIGNRVKTGAFVYGIFSFVDKLTNGLVAMGVQIGDPTDTDPSLSDDYYRDVMAWVCGGAAVMGLIATMTIVDCDRSSKRERLTESVED